jgi:hypothetical protein
MVDEKEAGAPPPRLATKADFEAVDIEAPIRGHDLADAHDMYGLYEQAFAAAKAVNDEPAQAVYLLIGQICSIGLRPSGLGNVWLPLFSFANGERSPVAEDYRGETAKLLGTIVSRIDSLALKARLADIAWSNNRHDAASAAVAIEAYCNIVDGLLDGQLKRLYDLNLSIAAKTPIHRALQIARFTSKSGTKPQNVVDTFERLYTATRDQEDIAILAQLAELALEFRLKDAATLAPQLEASAEAVPHGSYPIAVKSAWDLAARLYQSLKDPTSRQRCLMGAVKQTLAMRGQVSSAGAEAYWVMGALQQLRHVQGQEELKLNLEADLRRLQKASLEETASFELDLDIGDTPKRTEEHFGGLDLSNALRAFALLDKSRDPEQLRAEALEAARTSPLMATTPFTYVDGEGRTVTRSPGAPPDGEPDDVWLTHMIDRSESIRRQCAVAAYIDPARMAIQANFGLEPRHFEAIVGFSAFVPEGSKPIVALGFARFFQGEFISAAHLLILQLEPCLRQILKLNGADPTKRSDGSTEQDLSLNNIYARFRPALEKILTPALAWEIDRLFNTRPGPALRHEVAHGQLGGSDCYHPNVYYASWLIYRLCCLFVIKGWDELVTPHLTQEL